MDKEFTKLWQDFVADTKCKHIYTRPNVATLDLMLRDLFSEASKRQIAGVRTARSVLGRALLSFHPMIRAKIVPRCVEFLHLERYVDLQYESAWLLGMIASRSSEETAYVVQAGGIGPLIRLLVSTHSRVAEKAVWALGNIAGDGSLQRDAVINAGIIRPLVFLTFRSNTSTAVLWAVAGTFSNICQGTDSPPPVEVTKQCLPALAFLINKFHPEVVAEACWALSYISDGSSDHIDSVVRSSTVVPRLVQLLGSLSPEVVTASLSTIVNVVSGNDSHVETFLNAGILPQLGKLLKSSRADIVGSAAFTVANITAGNLKQIDMVMNEPGIITALISVLKNGEPPSQKEAIWAITSIISGGSADHTMQLESAGIVPALFGLLNIQDSKAIALILEGIENMLESNEMIRNKVSTVIQECGGREKIQMLQSHEDIEIHNQANRIMKNYFNANNDERRTVAESALGVLKDQCFCDLKFLVGPTKHEFNCHSLFLLARSPVIKAMASNKLATPGSVEAIPLLDVEPEIFQLFLEFMYGDKCPESILQAIKLLQVADRYNVGPLVHKCTQLMSEQEIKLGEAIQTFMLARKHSLEDLMNRAGALITREFLALSNHPTFRRVDEELLVYLLQKDDLPVGESELFTIVWRWAREQKARGIRKDSTFADVLKKIIPLIRFPLMTAEEFANHVYPKAILSNGEMVDLFAYLNSQSNAKLKEDIQKRLKFSTVPRKRQMELTIQLYECKLPKSVPKYKAAGAFADHTEDLEFIFNCKHSSKEEIGQIGAKIVAVTLQVPDWGLAKEAKDPPGSEAYTTEHKIFVTIEGVDAAAESIFAKEFSIKNGHQSELPVQPNYTLKDGCKYRIRMAFLGNGSHKRELGSGEIPLKPDLFSSSELKSSLAAFSSLGMIGLENITFTPRGRPDKDLESDSVPVGLKIVRGLKLLVK